MLGISKLFSNNKEQTYKTEPFLGGGKITIKEEEDESQIIVEHDDVFPEVERISFSNITSFSRKKKVRHRIFDIFGSNSYEFKIETEDKTYTFNVEDGDEVNNILERNK